MAGDLVEDGDRRFPVGNPHMDVEPAGDEASGRPLHRLDQIVVAGVGTHVLFPGDRERVGPCAHEDQPTVRRSRLDLSEGRGEIGLGLGGRPAHVGDDLERALVELVLHLRVLALIVAPTERRQHLARGRHEVTRRRVDDVELQLHANRRAGVVGEVDRPGHHPQS